MTTNSTDKLFSDTNITMKTGNLVRDPELLKNGKFYKLVIGNNKRYLDENDQEQTITNFFEILVSVNLDKATKEIAKMTKGDWIFVKGSDSLKPVTSAEGYTISSLTIYATEVKPITSNDNVEETEQAETA